mmetsp:Transcript_14978/g.30627  ORF Transcript_14978/g.30627 Transcript_14978/m.30627 type:complete len:369 (+) Transcript_14978:126-1232(+)
MKVPSFALAIVFVASTLVATDAAGDCSCDVESASSKTFKCGNDIYVCPGVQRICSVQGSQNSVYHAMNQAQCDQMHDVGIGDKCISLPGITRPKALSNRVCYDDTTNGFHGMKEDGSCDVCINSIPPPIEVVTIAPVDEGTSAPEEIVSPPTDAPVDDGTSATKEIIPQPTDAPVDDAVMIPPTSPNTDEPEDQLPPSCPGDIKLLQTHGVTGFPADNAGIRIKSQGTTTVKVELDQLWTSGSTATVDSIFYNYKTSLFTEQCFEKLNVVGGGTTDSIYDTIDITCNVITPIAYLEICVADNGGALTAQDNAIIPRCCQSELPPQTPKVCYHFEINCKTECVDEVTLQRHLRGSGNEPCHTKGSRVAC